MKNIAIFASGTGSNFLAIEKAISNKELDATISLFVTDKPQCKALASAKELNIHSFAFNAKDYESKKAFETEIVKELKQNNVELIVLAGYMRLIGETLLKEYSNRILNIHPSYLPNYKGKDAIGQALKDNATSTGVTVHYVDEGMDTGMIIDQIEVPIYKGEGREPLEKRVHKIEHQLYPKVIKKVLEEL